MTRWTDPACARWVETNSHGHLAETFAALDARKILDLGCGTGETAAFLAERGFDVLGIDPSETAIGIARQRSRPGLRFRTGAAEDFWSFPDRFDGAVFLNALHHVAPDRMADAVTAALGSLVPEGRLLVIEPLAGGSFFHAMRSVEDETDIRADAAKTVETVVGQGKARLVDLLRWDRVTRFADRESFLAQLVAVDPARAALVVKSRAAIAESWAIHARRDGDGFILEQPIVCWHLAPPD